MRNTRVMGLVVLFAMLTACSIPRIQTAEKENLRRIANNALAFDLRVQDAGDVSPALKAYVHTSASQWQQLSERVATGKLTNADKSRVIAVAGERELGAMRILSVEDSPEDVLNWVVFDLEQWTNMRDWVNGVVAK